MLTWQGGLVSAESAYPARLKPDLWLAIDGQGVLVGATSGTYSGRLDNESAITGALVGTENASDWKDKSKSGNHFTQGTGSQRPAWLADSENGFAKATFDFNSDHMVANTTLATDGGFSLAMVFISNNTSAGARIACGSVAISNGDRFLFGTAGANLRAGQNDGSGYRGSRSINISADTPYIGIYTFDGGTTGVLRLNGTVASGTTNPIGDSPTILGTRVGGNSNGSNPWIGQIAEVIIRLGSTVFTTTECQGLETYFAAKHGISI